MIKRLLYILLILLISNITFAQQAKNHKYYEKDYQRVWCNKNCGQLEYVLPDKTRVDCVTKNYAIEFDFAKKWAESIGQALYYSEILNKTPGVVLIIEDVEKDKKYIKRLNTVAKRHGIKVWLMYPWDMV